MSTDASAVILEREAEPMVQDPFRQALPIASPGSCPGLVGRGS